MDDFQSEPSYVFGLLEIIECSHFCGGSGGGGGGGGVVRRLKIDIRHDEETDMFQGAW